MARRLRPFRPLQVFHRAVYSIDLPEADGSSHSWVVDVNSLDEDSRVEVFRDGERRARLDTPGRHRVPGGTIEVDVSLYGVTRMHFVADDGSQRRLEPVAGTAEDRRRRLAKTHPRLSAWIGRVAVVVLLVNVALLAPQLLETLTHVPAVAERVGEFTSPIELSTGVNLALTLVGAVAAVERALTWRRHWLVDVETTGWDQ